MCPRISFEAKDTQRARKTYEVILSRVAWTTFSPSSICDHAEASESSAAPRASMIVLIPANIVFSASWACWTARLSHRHYHIGSTLGTSRRRGKISHVIRSTDLCKRGHRDREALNNLESSNVALEISPLARHHVPSGLGGHCRCRTPRWRWWRNRIASGGSDGRARSARVLVMFRLAVVLARRNRGCPNVGQTSWADF